MTGESLPPRDIPALLDELEKLPKYWHAAGALSPSILRAIARHAPAGLDMSAETGSGKSTLLLSRLARRHVVFSLDDGNGSIAKVLASPLLDRDSVEVIEGPSQRTLPAFRFEAPLQLALIDGPHGYPFPDLEYFHLYPHLDEGALLVVDDIHIRGVHNLFEFLKADAMFDLLEVIQATAFFRRTNAPTFDPMGDGWWLQGYNARTRWVDRSLTGTLKHLVPTRLKEAIKKRLYGTEPPGGGSEG